MSSEQKQGYDEYITLIGDSILDNKRYVGTQSPDIAKQLNNKSIKFNYNWKTVNCAIDGAVTKEIITHQIDKIPSNTTTIVISSGGNDGLDSLHELSMNPKNWWPWNFLYILYKTRKDFKNDYSETLSMIKHKYPNAKIICCTIYYPMFISYPSIIQLVANIGVNIMNNVIINTALKFGSGSIAVIDLRHVFDKKEDYANSIEPGVPGGDKLTNNIIHIIQNHDFTRAYKNAKDIVYTLREYSEDMDPYNRNMIYDNYWKNVNCDEQAGSVATRFFRRAFNERENQDIKYCMKFVLVTIICVSAACLMYKYK